MLKVIVVIAAVAVAVLLFAVVVAPATPDGSFVHDLGKDIRDSMSSWFGNPVMVE